MSAFGVSFTNSERKRPRLAGLFVKKHTIEMITRGMITGDGMFYWRCYGATIGIDQPNYGICRILIRIAIQEDPGYMPGVCLKMGAGHNSGHNSGTAAKLSAYCEL